MALPPFVYFAVGAAGSLYAAKEGYLSFLLNTYAKKEAKEDTARKEAKQQTPQTVYIQAPSEQGSTSWYPSIGISLLLLSGYYYYIHRHGTRKVIGKVEETSGKTQTLVKQSDENNEKRFDVLDKRNQERADNMEAEIRGETRAGFKIVTDQLYCLTQVCIETLSAVAQGSSSMNQDGEFGDPNEQLLSYGRAVQERADNILSEDNLVKTREQNLVDIRAEIQSRTEGTNTCTKGGEQPEPEPQPQPEELVVHMVRETAGEGEEAILNRGHSSHRDGLDPTAPILSLTSTLKSSFNFLHSSAVAQALDAFDVEEYKPVLYPALFIGGGGCILYYYLESKRANELHNYSNSQNY